MFLVVLTAITCGTDEAKTLEGFLQSIDTAQGEVVIVTEEGETSHLTLATEVREPVEPVGGGELSGTVEFDDGDEDGDADDDDDDDD